MKRIRGTKKKDGKLPGDALCWLTLCGPYTNSCCPHEFNLVMELPSSCLKTNNMKTSKQFEDFYNEDFWMGRSIPDTFFWFFSVLVGAGK